MTSSKQILQKDTMIIASDLLIAKTFWQRTKGLLGHKSLFQNQAMWIWSCNSIHTFFMRFTIDAVFVDATLRIVETHEHLTPGKITWPILRAKSVFEMPSGTIRQFNLKKGDQLYVGP